MKVADKIAVGVQAGADTLQAGTRKAAQETIRVGADKAALTSLQGASLVGGVGITAAISAALSQMEYEDKKRDFRKLYKEELAFQFDKDEKKVKDGDVDRMAKHNFVFAEHLQKAKKERNLGFGTIFVATVISLAVVAAATGAGIIATAGLAGFVAKAAVAMGTYALVKRPLQGLGDKIFHMDEKTAHERIEEIHIAHKLGKTVSNEQVFSVFVHANPELGQYIENKFGKKFDELNIIDRQGLTEIIGEKINIKKITDDINHGRVKATELAFTVEGKASGVLPKQGEAPKHSVLMTIKEKLHDAGNAIAHPIQHHHEVAERKFAERVVRVPKEQMGHVQRLEEARAQEALAAQQR